MSDEQSLGAQQADGLSQAEPEEVSALFDPSRWQALATAPKDRRILVLCDHAAPWPVMIGRWDGERWNSKDEATDGKKWKVLAWQPLPEPGPFELQCSFCAKFVSEVGKLIAGPTVFICNECVALCGEILIAEVKARAAASAIEASGQDGETRLDAKHESAVGSEASETPHTSQNTPKETSHD
jgi:hypothetical protein